MRPLTTSKTWNKFNVWHMDAIANMLSAGDQQQQPPPPAHFTEPEGAASHMELQLWSVHCQVYICELLSYPPTFLSSSRPRGTEQMEGVHFNPPRRQEVGAAGGHCCAQARTSLQQHRL